ncbi:MAG: 2-amino-4-hydroxy-6-hydroxymethyldihydropteridine diphosphokinase [Streptosporangiaceae bacterium]
MTGPDDQTASAAPADRQVVLSLGSNLGDRLGNLQLGVNQLAAGGLVCQAISSVYETAPVGGPEQEDYLNAVLLAVTALPARAVLASCAAAEAAAGRVRTVRFGSRTLDVDIITVDGETSADPELTLPHPRAHERAFVLAPWLELDPDAVLPGSGRAAQLLAAAGPAGVRRRPDLRLTLPGKAGPQAGRAEADLPCR